MKRLLPFFSCTFPIRLLWPVLGFLMNRLIRSADLHEQPVSLTISFIGRARLQNKLIYRGGSQLALAIGMLLAGWLSATSVQAQVKSGGDGFYSDGVTAGSHGYACPANQFWRHAPILDVGTFTGTPPASPANYIQAGYSAAEQTFTGDVNGDGKIDLIWVYEGGGPSGSGTTVWLGNGDGTFSHTPIIDKGSFVGVLQDGQTNIIQAGFSASESTFMGDVNGDGKLDIVWIYEGANPATSGTAVWLGNGDGTWSHNAIVDKGSFVTSAGLPGGAVIQAGQSGAESTYMIDTNGDGKLDIVWLYDGVGSHAASGTWIWLGNGDGTWNHTPVSDVGNFATIVQAGATVNESTFVVDMNNDGFPDVLYIYDALGNHASSGTTVWLGNGDGTFQHTPITDIGSFTGQTAGGGNDYIEAGLTGTESTRIVDVNNDGNVDLVWVYEGGSGTSVWLGNGNGTFQHAVRTDRGTFTGTPPQGTANTIQAGSTNSESFFMVDLNGDNALDIFWVIEGSSNGGTAVWLAECKPSVAIISPINNGATSLNPTISGTATVGSVVTITGPGNTTLCTTTAVSGTYACPITVSAGPQNLTAIASSVNGTSTPATVSFLAAAFVATKSASDGYTTDGAGPGPNGFNCNGIQFWKHAPIVDQGTFTGTPPGGGGAGYFQAGLSNAEESFSGDVNGDGKIDLVWIYEGSNSTNSGTTVYLGNGDGTFSHTPIIDIGSFTGVLQDGQTNKIQVGVSNQESTYMGDVNNDGKLDIIWIYEGGGNAANAGTAVWLGNGNGTWSHTAIVDKGAFQATGMPGGNIIQAGQGTGESTFMMDVNKDGKLDIVWVYDAGGNHANSGTWTWLGNGDGTWAHTAISDVGNFNTYIEASVTVNEVTSMADVNGDGYPDIIWIYDGGGNSALSRTWVWLGNGNGTWNHTQISDQGSFTGLVAGGGSNYIEAGLTGTESTRIVDVNNDGKADIVWVYEGGGSANSGTSVWLGNGDGTWQHAVKTDRGTFTGTAPQSTANVIQAGVSDHEAFFMFDTNGDGALDIVWGIEGTSNGGTAVWLGSCGTPTVAVNKPFNNASVATTSTISGTATAGSVVTIKGPGNTTLCTTTAVSGTYACPVTLSTGPQILTVTASNASDTSTPVQLTLTAFTQVSVTQGGNDGWTTEGLTKGTNTLNDCESSGFFRKAPILDITNTWGGANMPGGFNNMLQSGVDGTQQSFLADVNNDGKLDMLWVYDGTGTAAQSGTAAWLGLGDGKFNHTPIIDKGSFTGAVYGGPNIIQAGINTSESTFLVDANGDGKLDILFIVDGGGNAAQAGTYVWLGNGDGTFAHTSISDVGNFTGTIFGGTNIIQSGYTANESTHVQDVNNDGKVDIIWIYDGSCVAAASETVVWLGNGDGTFSHTPIIDKGSFGASVLCSGNNNIIQAGEDVNEFTTMVDMNNDGKVDVVWMYSVGSATSGIWVWTGNGDGTFAHTPIKQQGVFTGNISDGGTNLIQSGITSSETTRIVDVNGDGNMDVVWIYDGAGVPANAGVWVWKGNGDGTVATTPVIERGGFTGSIYTNNNIIQAGQTAAELTFMGDLNNDGKIDILWTTDAGGSSASGSAVWLAGCTITLAVNSPSNNANVATTSIISGTATAGSVVTIKGPGNTTLCTTTAVSGTYACPVTLSTGPQILTVTASNASGDTSTPVQLTLTAFTQVAVSTASNTYDMTDGLTPGVSPVLNSCFSGSQGIWKRPAVYKTGYTGGTSSGFNPGENPNESTFIVDIDKDGKKDLVWVHDGGMVNAAIAGVYIWKGIGDGTFTTAVTKDVNSFSANGLALGTNNIGLGGTGGSENTFIADANGDGNLDLIWLFEVANTSYVWLGNGDGTFQHTAIVKSGYTGGPNGVMSIGITASESTYLVDVDSDGKLDVVWLFDAGGNPATAGVYIWKGNGDGTFATAVIKDVNTFTANGVAQGASSGGTSVGFGGISSGETTHMADFNNDGKVDIFWAYEPENRSCVWLGNGNGTFQHAAIVKNGYTGGGSNVMSIGFSGNESTHIVDADGDGNLDVVWLFDAGPAVANAGAYIWRGLGNGTFVTAATKDIGAFTGNSVANGTGNLALGGFTVTESSHVVDLNGDGKVDLLWLYENTNSSYAWLAGCDITLAVNSPSNNAQTGVNTIVSGTATAGSIVTILGPNNTTLCTTTAVSGTYACSLTLSPGPQTLTVTAGNGAGINSTPVLLSLTAVSVTPSTASNTYDMTDGLTAGTSPVLNPCFTGTQGIWKKAAVFKNGYTGGVTSGFNPGETDNESTFLVDIDKDGKKDIVWVFDGNMTNAAIAGVYIWKGNGDGTFATAVTKDVNSFTANGVKNGTGSLGLGGTSALESTFIADVNGDGNLDLIWLHETTNSSYIWLGNGDGTFQHTAIVKSGYTGGPNGLMSIGLSDNESTFMLDVDSDGKIDVVWLFDASVTVANAGVYYWKGNGDGTFATAPIKDIGTGTFTANGVAQGASSGGTTVAFGGISNVESTHMADFNNDGKVDILWAHESQNRTFVWLGNGDGTFQHAAIVKNGYTGGFSNLMSIGFSGNESTHIVDADGDGNLDVVWLYDGGVTTPTAGAYIWRGLGDGTFASAATKDIGTFTSNNVANGTSTVALGGFTSLESSHVADLNGDGKVDLLWLFENTNSSYAWLAGCTQVAILSPANNSQTSLNPVISGTATPGSTVVILGPGSTTLCTTTAVSGTYSCPATVSAGPKTLTAIASSADGVSTPATVSFTAAVASLTVVSAPSTLTVASGVPTSGSAAQAIAPTGGTQPFTYSVYNPTSGSATSSTGPLATSHGTVSINPTTGVYSYTPTPGYSGTDAIGIKVCDSGTPQQCAATVIPILVTAPFTVNTTPASLTTVPNTPATGSAATALNPQGGTQPLTYSTINPTTGAASTSTAHGTVSIDPNTGVYSYTPTPGYSGTDAIGIKVCDSSTPPQCATSVIPVTVSSPASGTLDCSTAQILGIVAGTPGSGVLKLTMTVSTTGSFPVTISGSGLSVNPSPFAITVTDTGLQTFYVPLTYSGAAFGPTTITVTGAGVCSPDMSLVTPKTVTTSVLNLGPACTPVSAATLIK